MVRRQRGNRGRKIVAAVATLGPKVKRGRGRPVSLANTLGGRRDSIYDVLSANWCAIGWKLQTARSIQGVRNALRPAENNQYIARFLVSGQFAVEPDQTALRNARMKRKEIVTSIDKLEEQVRREEAFLQKFRRARAENRKQAKRLKRPYEAQRQRTRRLVRLCNQRKQEEEELTKQIWALESHLACAEICRFVRDKRYAFTPTNLANAMAGLPEIGYRRSVARCLKMKNLMGGSFSFQVFTTIRRLLKKCHDSRYRLVTCFRKSIPRTRMHDFVRSHLCDQWYFLRSVLEKVDVKRTHPGELPFAICDAFRRRCNGPRNAIDEVQLEREKIEI